MHEREGGELFPDEKARWSHKDNLMNLAVAMVSFNPDVSNQHALIEHHILYFITSSLGLVFVHGLNFNVKQ